MKRLVRVSTYLFLLPSLLWAQSIKIEAMRPQFKFAGGEPSLWTSAWFATLKVPVIKEGVSFIGQLPFAFGKLEDATVPASGESIGNPGFGLEFGGRNHSILVMLRVPLVQNNFGAFIGSVADFQRQEAFVPDIIPLSGIIKTTFSINKFSVQPYGGLSFNIVTQHDSVGYFETVFEGLQRNDGELHLLYGAEGWYDFDPFYLGASFSGRGWLSSGGSLDESLVNEGAVLAKFVFENVSPSAFFRFPLEDLLLDSVFGLRCNIEF
jgi:hypothetical protein